MSKRKVKQLLLVIGLLSLMSILTLVAYQLGWLGTLFQQSEVSAHEIRDGRIVVPVSVVASHELEGFPASNLIKNVGFIGTAGKLQKHLTDPTTMWRTAEVKDAELSLLFDFGRTIPLSEIWIWNYNEANHDGKLQSQRGLKDIKLYISTDGTNWTEWTGEGYPFQLAKAEGTNRESATNLNNESHTPITFDALPVKAVKIVAQAAVNQGNWGGDDGQENVFGLSKVVFYSYSESLAYGSMIYGQDVSVSPSSTESISAIISNFGMNGIHTRNDFHDADATGLSMWLSDPLPADQKLELTFDLGGTYPLEAMAIWNYNRKDDREPGTDYTSYGMKDVKVYHSLDSKTWTELQTTGYPYRLARADGSPELQATNLDDGSHSPILFDNTIVRYVKIEVDPQQGGSNWGGLASDPARYGLSEVRFFVGEGFAAESAEDWDTLFSKYFEWSGADGIYSIPLSGYDQPYEVSKDGTVSSEEVNLAKTWFLFSDTFIGVVNGETKKRTSTTMTNNTGAYLIDVNPDPAQIEFKYGTDGQGINTKSMFEPDISKVKPGFVQPEIPIRFWYWLQDGVVANGNLYIIPLLMKDDAAGAAGFQFKTDGAALLKIPLNENLEPMLEKTEQLATPLFYRKPDSRVTYVFGAGIMANTVTSGAPNPDGYIYVYGYRDELPRRSLLVARVLETQFESMDSWTFWNGSSWSSDIADAVDVAENVSPELSVTPMVQADGTTRYMLIYQKGTIGSVTAYRLAEQPWGPFGDEVVLYMNTAYKLGPAVMAYNAKAHPHLSAQGELLVTYNVNSINFKTNMDNADVYRPRWVRIKQIIKPSS